MKVGYYDEKITESKDKDVKLGRDIYMSSLAGRRGFRDDHLGIEDNDIWIDIFKSIGKHARKQMGEEK